MLTHVAASSASSLVAISSSQQESSAIVNSTSTTTAQQTSDTVTTASAIVKGGRKKERKTTPGVLQRALEKDCAIVINPPVGTENRKRSRKQKISTLTDTVDELAPVVRNEGKAPKKRRAKKEKVVVPSKKTVVSVASDSVCALDSVNSSAPQQASSVSLAHELCSNINFSKLIYPKLCFEIFGDLSRNISAISPSQVIVAVESTTDIGSLNEIHIGDDVNNPNCEHQFSLYKSLPHFIPVTGSLYARSEPLARILPFSQLSEYTLHSLQHNKTNTFRFHGNRFEKRLPDIPQEEIEKYSRKRNQYRASDLIIKHPLLGFYHRKLTSLKFVIIKRVAIKGTEFAAIKARVVQLRRTADLKNIEIFVDESDIIEKALDVNAMNNNHNIQPVIQTPSGIVPVIANTNTYLPSNQSYQHQPYAYLRCQYQDPTPQVSFDNNTATTFNIANSFSVNNNNNGSLIRTSDYPSSTLVTENGTQLLILHQGPSSYIHPTHQLQQIVEDGHVHSQLPLPEQFRFQLQSEQQQQQHVQRNDLLPKDQQPKLIGHIQLVNPNSDSYHIVQSPYSVETGIETNSATSYPSSQQLQILPAQQIQYQTQPQTQPNYTFQQQVSGPVQAIHQHQSQNIIQEQGGAGQSIQYTFLSQQSTNCPSGNQEQFLQHLYHQPSTTQTQTSQAQLQHHSQHIHQTVVADLPPVNHFKQSLQPHIAGPQLAQNFHDYSSSPAPGQPQLQVLPVLPPVPLVAPPPAAPVNKQKGVKQSKGPPKKPKATSHQIFSPPTTLSEEQLRQLQQRANPTSVYELGGVPGSVSSSSGLVVPHSQSGTPSLPSSLSISPASSSPKAEILKAAKSQDTSSSPSPSHATVPNLANPKTVPALSPSSSSGSKQITVLPSNTTKTTESALAVSENRPAKKEGYVAVCPRCGVCTVSLIRCVRCKSELPADVRLIKDGFKVSKIEAVVVIPKAVTASGVEGSASEKSSGTTINTIQAGPSVTTLKQKVGGNSGGRKIILVNKPAILGVAGKTPNVATGTVHVAIQQDGGSHVTILNSNSKSASKSTKPIPKKRAPPRKRQQELITLSSDDEESDSQPNPLKTEKSSASVEAQCTSSSIESSLAPATTTTTNQEEGEDSLSSPNNMAKKKGLAINLSPDLDNPSTKRRKEEETGDKTPEQIFDEISKRMGEPGCKFQYAMVQCRSVRIGSYKVTTSDTGFEIPVTFTELGIKLTLPHANFKHKQIKMCIPLNVILSMTAHFSKKLPVFFISTGPKYARFVREKLGLDGSPDSESSNYFCPQNGRPTQKKITLLIASEIKDADIGIIKSLYPLILTDIDYTAANKMLMNVTPETYRNSISYNNDDSPESPPTPKIVSTSSAATGSIVQSHDSSTSTKSSSNSRDIKTCQPNSSSVSASATTSVTNQDPGSAVLFYQGENNIKVPICPNDISCLGHSQFLNDQIIDFWLAVIQTERLEPVDKKRTFVFDSFFYSKLTEKVKKQSRAEGGSVMSAGERRHARVKKRTKNVDIFKKDFLIVPINENYHWFIAIICFPGLQGYHDYESLEPLPNFKRPKITKSPRTAGPKPIIYNQPKSESTASYSNRDEAPEDPEEMESQMSTEQDEDCSSPMESKAETDSNHTRSEGGGGVKRKSEFGERVKHPCILIFDSLAGDARGRVFSTLREYLKIEYKTKKQEDRTFDKNTIPGCMPKVPQQPNFSDCGLFMLQYIESFFSSPIQNYDTHSLNLKNWFETSIAENKRREIYDFILSKVEQLYPQNLNRIPPVNFEAGEEGPIPEHEGASTYTDEEDESDDIFVPVKAKAKVRRRKSDSDDHNYAKGNSASTSTSDASKE